MQNNPLSRLGCISYIRLLIAGVILSLSMVYVTTVHACYLELEGLDDIHIVFDNDYSSKSDTGRTLSDIFKVSGSGSECLFFITFSAGSNGRKLVNPGGEILSYGLYDSVHHSNSLKDLPSATISNVLTGKSKKGQSIITLEYYFHVPYIKNSSPGLYNDTIQISLYAGDLNNYTLKDTANVTFSAEVPSWVELYLHADSGSLSNAVLDFGILQPGTSKSFHAEVLTNTPYDISITSEYLGAMKLTDRNNEAYVPYALFHNGSLIPLESSSIISNSARANNTGQFIHPFDIVIGETDFAPSGEYADSLLFTISAR